MHIRKAGRFFAGMVTSLSTAKSELCIEVWNCNEVLTSGKNGRGLGGMRHAPHYIDTPENRERSTLSGFLM